MIVKSKSYKNQRSIRSVIHYVMREAEREGSFVLARFVQGKDYSPDTISDQFQENEKHRVHQRKNSVKVHMEILSFHPDDSEKLKNRNDILEKIARKYISLRSNLAMCVATVHRDTKHTHLHFVFSGVEWRSGKSTRLSKAEFQKIKLDMEAFQKSRFPQLSRSEIDHNPSKKKRQHLIKDPECQMKLRGVVSDKERLVTALEKAYVEATSEKNFYSLLKKEGFELYHRGGRQAGVVLKRQFRFRTLGYNRHILKALEKNLSKLKRLETIARIRNVQREHQRGRTR